MRLSSIVVSLLVVTLGLGIRGVVRAEPLSIVPEFTLFDQNGAPVALSSFAGKVVVLEWTNPDCPFVRRHYEQKTTAQLLSRFKERDIVWLAVNSSRNGSVERNKAWAAAQELSFPVLDDHEGRVGRMVGAKTTPHVFVLNRSHVVVYDGAIDNDPDGEVTKGRVNYLEIALDDASLGRPVLNSKTVPYGCSIKYAP